jgi:hypothetical protein
MPKRKLTDKVLLDAIQAFRDYGTYGRAAAALGIKTSTLRKRITTLAVNRGLFQVPEGGFVYRRSDEEIQELWERQVEVGFDALAVEEGITCERLKAVFRQAGLIKPQLRVLDERYPIGMCDNAMDDDPWAREWEALKANHIVDGMDDWTASERATVDMKRRFDAEGK